MNDLIIKPPRQQIQCQIPPCRRPAMMPARTPVLCDVHQALDTRKGKFSTLLMWMALYWMSEAWMIEARKMHAAGEDIDLDVWRWPLAVEDVTNMILRGVTTFLDFFPHLREACPGECSYVENTFPLLARKPQVHMIGIYLKMLDCFEGLKAVRVIHSKPRLIAYTSAPPSWAEQHIRKLESIGYESGLKGLVVTQLWETKSKQLGGNSD